jgi:hypothetical protein
MAVDLDEADLAIDADLENADPGDFGDLDADDAGLQAALTVLAVLADDISDVGEVAWNQPSSYRVPAAPRGTDAGRRSAARSPRSAFVLAGGRSQPDLLDERMSVGYPGGGVTTG